MHALDAKGAGSPSVPRADQLGPMDEWLDKMEAKAQAHLEIRPQRPGKEIAKVNGPTNRFGKGMDNGPKGMNNGPTNRFGKGMDNGPKVLGKVPKEAGRVFKQTAQSALEEKKEARVPWGNHVAGPSPTIQNAQATRTDEYNNGKGKPAFSKGSWADKVRASSAKSRFSLESDLIQEHGQPEYSLPDEFIDEDFGEWTRCLVGFIPGSSFPFYAARAIALREWKHYGIETAYTYEGFFIFRFQSEEKVQEVLADGPWLFGGKFMMLQQWNACFVFDKSKLSKAPVWVKLKGLPFTLWSNKALSFVAGIVGKPLSCDRATHERSRLSYARVCVEVDANKPYVHNFFLNCKLSSEPIRVGVEYEWKPQRCPNCCVYGHNCEVKPTEGQRDGSSKEAGKEDTGPVVNVGKSGAGVILEANVREDIGGRELTSDDPEGNETEALTYADKLVGKVLSSKAEADTSNCNLEGGIPVQQEIGKASEDADQSNDRAMIPAPNMQMVIAPTEAPQGFDVCKVTNWEKRELDSLGLIPIDLEELGSVGDSNFSGFLDGEEEVLMVDPLMAIGDIEGVCQINTKASLSGSSLAKKTLGDFIGSSGEASCSSKPQKLKGKGKKKGGANPRLRSQ